MTSPRDNTTAIRSTRLTEDEAGWLAQRARAEGVTGSQLLRNLIQAAMDGREPDAVGEEVALAPVVTPGRCACCGGRIPDMSTFAGRLRDLAARRGFSISGLAGSLGVARNTVNNYLSGATEPSMAALLALSATLRCSIDYLAGGKGEPDE